MVPNSANIWVNSVCDAAGEGVFEWGGSGSCEAGGAQSAPGVVRLVASRRSDSPDHCMRPSRLPSLGAFPVALTEMWCVALELSLATPVSAH